MLQDKFSNVDFAERPAKALGNGFEAIVPDLVATDVQVLEDPVAFVNLKRDGEARQDLGVEVHVGDVDPVDNSRVLEIAEEETEAGGVHVAVCQFDALDAVFSLENEVPEVGHEVDVKSLIVENVNSL